MAFLLNRTFVNATVRMLVSDADYAAVELFKGYPDVLLKLAFACCVIFMIIGIPGNFITIVALARYKRISNATAIFIMNLSCADLLFCSIDPYLAASTFWNRSWTHGRVLCRLSTPARHILITVSYLSVLAITVNRYVIIIYPRLYGKIYQKRNIAIMLAVIWIAPLIALIPTILGKWGRIDLDSTIGLCTIVPDENKRSSKQILVLVGFGLSCIPITFCYARIYFVVRKSTKKHPDPKSTKNSPNTSAKDSIHNCEDKEKDIPRIVVAIPKLKLEHSTTETTDSTGEETSEYQEPPRIKRTINKRSIVRLKISLPTRKDKRLGTMIFAVMATYFLSYIPIVITKILLWGRTYPAANITTHIFVCFSLSINPVVYVAMSSEYQKAYRKLFKRCSCVTRQ